MDDSAAAAPLDALGARLRRARRERDLTMEQVAARTAISQPSLSRLESGARQPSLAQLLTLAQFYGVAVGELLAEPPAAAAVVIDPARAPERDGNGLRFRVLDRRDAAAALSALRVTVPAAREGEHRYEHAGDEWLYVLSGTLRLTLGDEVHTLGPGMAAHFDASTPHRLDAARGRDVELLLVAARPSAQPLGSYVAESA